MKDTLGGNRLLHIFGTELIDYEASISQHFANLRAYCAFEHPPAETLHRLVRSILLEAAQVSLIFFPSPRSKKDAELRSKFLRSEFQIPQGSLLNERVLRNHLAHMDERLDKWALHSTNKTFGRCMLGTRAHAEARGISSEDILGLFDPKGMVFSFVDDDLNIDDLVGEIQSVSRVARKKLREVPWDGKAN